MKKGILGILGVFTSFIGGIILGRKSIYLNSNKDDDRVVKFKAYYNILNQWLFLKQKGKNLHEYFNINNYKTIGIYGMGELGTRLYEELKDSNIVIKYVADKSSSINMPDVNISDVKDMSDDVDVIVVTPIFAMDDIRIMLEKRLNCPIISLEDIVYEISVF